MARCSNSDCFPLLQLAPSSPSQQKEGEEQATAVDCLEGFRR